METRVISTLLYGAENWILGKGCLELLETFRQNLEEESSSSPGTTQTW